MISVRVFFRLAKSSHIMSYCHEERDLSSGSLLSDAGCNYNYKFTDISQNLQNFQPEIFSVFSFPGSLNNKNTDNTRLPCKIITSLWHCTVL